MDEMTQICQKKDLPLGSSTTCRLESLEPGHGIDLINNIVKEGCIPHDWRKSILVRVYKGKCDPLVCGSYRAIKLLEQPMKVLERVLEKRIRCQVSIDNMQFGFMPGKGTSTRERRQVQEKHQAKKKKKLYYAMCI